MLTEPATTDVDGPATTVYAREATAVAAYSTRARPGATVSTPLDWDELTTAIRADQFHVGNVPARLAALDHDPWHDIAKVRQSLTAKVRSSVGL